MARIGPARHYVGTYIRQMQDWSESAVKKMASNTRQPVAARIAAKTILRAMEDGFTRNGVPLADRDVERMLDRTEGKPVQAVLLDQTGGADPVELKSRLAELARRFPDLKRSILEGFAVVLPEEPKPVLSTVEGPVVCLPAPPVPSGAEGRGAEEPAPDSSEPETACPEQGRGAE